MRTIQATVSPRLLSKASRLFTGSLEGRVIEILQNARRAGATEVEIVNQGGYVTVRDNGIGIEDFAKLLDLGGSGWEDAFESSEDPAGVGIFCLAPREVTIRSRGMMATISGEGWTGAPVTVLADPDAIETTELRFEDESWSQMPVERNAVFTGLKVMLDDQPCPQASFVSDQAADCPELGCRVEVREGDALDPWHLNHEHAYHNNGLVNFHGQVVAFDFRNVGERGLHFLVDMTSEPTGIRLMLPARTRLVENDALEKLRDIFEVEGYRYIRARGHHRLSYKDYMRAGRLGVNLPEAEPTFMVGLLTGHGIPLLVAVGMPTDDGMPSPVAVRMPEDLPLAKCYRFAAEDDDADTDETNTHILAALGTFEAPFVPVSIRECYDGYDWADLETVTAVEVETGNILHESHVWLGDLVCVDSITITVHTSNGRTWRSPVCMAVQPSREQNAAVCWDDEVFVTPEAEWKLSPSDIWSHLGGSCDEGDTYDTQEFAFEEQLDAFWAEVAGPDEHLRRRIAGVLSHIPSGWESMNVLADGNITIQFQDGSVTHLVPPGI